MMDADLSCLAAGREIASASHPWDQAAHGWNHHASVIRAWLEDATRAMLDAARIGVGDHVLDIAAGAGDQTLDIARRVGPSGRVLATDISATILALAAENARAAGLRQVETRVADAEKLGLAGAGFDAAVCRLGLMFCESPLEALKQVRAALRPHGRFSALVFSQPRNNPCLGIVLATALRHAGRPAAAPDRPGTLMSLGAPGLVAKLLSAAGFVDIEARAVEAPFRLSSARDYVEFVRTSATPVIDLLASLPEVAQRAAWNEMIERLEVFSTPAGWVGPNELLLCSAEVPA